MKYFKALIFYFILLPCFAEAQLSEEKLKELKKAISILHVQSDFLGIGTGFLISPTMLITNAHVVDSPKSITAIFHLGEEDEKEYKVKVMLFDPKIDLAILELEEEVHLPFYFSLGSVDEIEGLNERIDVFTLGYPEGQFHDFYGYILEMDLKSDAYEEEYYYRFRTQIQTTYGGSGSPLISLKTGQVLGVMSSINPNYGGISFAILVDHLVKLIEEGHGDIEQDLIDKNIPIALLHKGLVQEAALQGDMRSKFILMQVYEILQDDESEDVQEKILELKEEIFKSVNHDLLQDVALYYIEKEDFFSALLFLEKSVELGNIYSKIILAIFYEKGMGVEESLDKSQELYTEVIEELGGLDTLNKYRHFTEENFPRKFIEMHAFLYFYFGNFNFSMEAEFLRSHRSPEDFKDFVTHWDLYEEEEFEKHPREFINESLFRAAEFLTNKNQAGDVSLEVRINRLISRYSDAWATFLDDYLF